MGFKGGKVSRATNDELKGSQRMTKEQVFANAQKIKRR